MMSCRFRFPTPSFKHPSTLPSSMEHPHRCQCGGTVFRLFEEYTPSLRVADSRRVCIGCGGCIDDPSFRCTDPSAGSVPTTDCLLMVIRHADDGRVPIDSFTDDGLDALEDAFDAMGLDHQLHRDVPRGYREALDDLLGWGFLRMEDGTIRITDEGLRQVESVTGSMEGPDVSVLAASAREFADGGRTTSRRIAE